ncbi:Aspartate-semialdehyde dehydrogenase [Frankliniella fusca]|uniref:Aspartate-semialdehyde dehydrogenase n=1 Tax=Frankliniella fusca TaxID=407009 RepID=A0AAE1GT79_9NEOP|nr:Aspartate-semialdehyde dehydrogenase [Frankliniella fusca]
MLTEDWFYTCHCCLDPCYLVLQNDVFRNGSYRAEDFDDVPVIPQVPPPEIIYSEGIMAEPEFVDLTMED